MQTAIQNGIMNTYKNNPENVSYGLEILLKEEDGIKEEEELSQNSYKIEEEQIFQTFKDTISSITSTIDSIRTSLLLTKGDFENTHE